MLLQACGTAAYYAKFTLAEKRIAVLKSEFQYSTKKGELRERSTVLVKPDGAPFPIALHHQPEGYTACLMRCTHQACEVEIQGERYACPCHGSEFDVQGQVLKGPAEKSLQTFKTEEDEQHVFILLA